MMWEEYLREAIKHRKPVQTWETDGHVVGALLLVSGLNSEAGEVADLVVKHIKDGTKQVDRTAMALELGDVAWYLGMLLDLFDLTLEEVLQLNHDKLEDRYASD